MLAAAERTNLPPENGRPANQCCLHVDTWSEEAFQVSLQLVRDLSAGVLKRDPNAKRPRPPAPQTPPLKPTPSAKLTRWQLNQRKRAALEGKTLEQLKEEERRRGQDRRRQTKETHAS